MKKYPSLYSVLISLLSLIAIPLFTACDDDDDDVTYEYPDAGQLCVLHTDGWGRATSFTNDDDEIYYLLDPYYDSTGYLQADKDYRAIVYYNYSSVANYVSWYDATIYEPYLPITGNEVSEVKYDPIQGIDDVWVSNNGSYINLSIYIFATAGSDVQEFQFIHNGTNTAGHTELLVYHDQVSMYSYYYYDSVYLCIPVAGYFVSGEVIDIVFRTYDEGEVVKTVTIP